MTILEFITTGSIKKSWLAGAALALLCCASASGRTQTCDEACLKGFMDGYLQALAAHDSSTLPLAVHYRYTENGAELESGYGRAMGDVQLLWTVST